MEKSDLTHKNFCERLSTLPLAKPFLGREYLTWLWFISESQGKGLSLGEGNSGKPWSVDVWVDDRILLQSWDQRGHENLLRGGDPSHSQEAAASLSSGKVVRELKLGLHVHGVGDYTCTLKADTLTPSGLRLPTENGDNAGDSEEMEEIGAEAWLSARLLYCDIFLEIHDALFAWFIHERSQPDWESKGLSKMKQWITDRQKQIPQTKLLH